MQYSTQLILAVLGFGAQINAHMKLSKPAPFGAATLNNSPLLADGSDFPCKQRTGVYDADTSNSMALGSTQPLAFIGGASHGGGSCQVSITYDPKPDKNSVWKVIHSIEGGCPVKNQVGNIGTDADAADPDTYSFTVPTSLPTGTAVLAWTWFNKVGNREMYMNCAPITLTGGSSKRTIDEENLVANITQLLQRDTAAYDALPDMFVANIGNGCGTKDSTDVLFPNPGDSVEQLGTQTSSALAAPTGSCATAAGGSSPTSAATSAAAATTKAATSAPVATAANTGGVFVTVAPTSSAAAIATTLATSIAPVATSSAAVVSSAAPVSSSAPSTGVSGVQSGACTDEGAWNCIGGTQFQRCASGEWSVAMAVAAGTTCGASGIETNMNIVASTKERRRSRNVHVRRHIQRSS